MMKRFILQAAFLSLIVPLQASASEPDEREARSLESTRLFAAKYPAAKVVTEGGSSIPSLIVRPGAVLDRKALSAGAHAFVTDWAEMFGLDRRHGELSLKKVVETRNGTACRFSQIYKGLTVLDADIVVRTDNEGGVLTVSNGLENVGEVPVDFRAKREEAIAAALGSLEVTDWSGAPRRVEKVVANVGGEHAAVWVVEFFARKPFGLWRVLVAGDGGGVIHYSNIMRTAQGYAYLDCPETGAYQTVTLQNLTSSTNLSGTYIDVYTLSGYSSTRLAKADGSGNFLYAPKETTASDPFAEVQAYYNLNRLHAYFDDNDFNYLDGKVTVYVNYSSGEMACNAGSAGDQIYVGYCSESSPSVNFAYDADVLMHEYTHSAVAEAANLTDYAVDDWGLRGMPLGLNEGYSDTIASIVTGDGVIGKHVAKAFGGGQGLRNLTTGHPCPQYLRGEAHEDGIVWGNSSWKALKNSGDDPAVGKVLLEALSSISSNSTFKDAAHVVLTTADSYGASIKSAFQSAYDSNNVLECGREAPVKSGAPLSGWLLSPSSLGIYGSYTPFVIQYKLYVPEGATSLDVNVYAEDVGTGADKTSKVKVYVNQGSRVIYSSSSPTAQWNSNGQKKLTINSPASGWYWILPVGGSFSGSQGYAFSITPKYYGAATQDGGVEPDDAGEETDSGTEEDGGISEDAQGGVDASAPDAGAQDGSAVVDDAGGGEGCECDQTTICDPDCACDPECPGTGTGTGCSCSTVTFN